MVDVGHYNLETVPLLFMVVYGDRGDAAALVRRLIRISVRIQIRLHDFRYAAGRVMRPLTTRCHV